MNRVSLIFVQVRAFFTENFSYKVVSLFIALILWMTILGRRDFIFVKAMNIEYRAAPGFVVNSRPESVQVRVSGNRAALRRFMESNADQNIVIDVSGRGAGVVEVETPLSQIEVPLGIKILSIRPGVIRAEILPDANRPPLPEPFKETR